MSPSNDQLEPTAEQQDKGHPTAEAAEDGRFWADEEEEYGKSQVQTKHVVAKDEENVELLLHKDETKENVTVHNDPDDAETQGVEEEDDNDLKKQVDGAAPTETASKNHPEVAAAAAAVTREEEGTENHDDTKLKNSHLAEKTETANDQDMTKQGEEEDKGLAVSGAGDLSVNDEAPDSSNNDDEKDEVDNEEAAATTSETDTKNDSDQKQEHEEVEEESSGITSAENNDVDEETADLSQSAGLVREKQNDDSAVTEASSVEQQDQASLPVVAAATATVVKPAAQQQPTQNNKSLRAFGGRMLQSMVGQRRSEDKRKKRGWFGGGNNKQQLQPKQRDAVYVISGPAPPVVATTTTVTTTTTAQTNDTTTTTQVTTATTTTAVAAAMVETLSDPRLQPDKDEDEVPPVVVKSALKSSMKYASPASYGSRDGGASRQSTVRFAENLNTDDNNNKSGETMGISAADAGAAIHDDESSSDVVRMMTMADDEHNYPSTMALPPAPSRINDNDDDAFCVQVQEQLNDQVMEEQFDKREKQQRPKLSMKQVSMQFARSVMSIREIRVEHIKQLPQHAYKGARQSFKKIKKLDKKYPWRVRPVLLMLLGGIICACLVWFGILGKDLPAPIKNWLSPEEYAENDPFYNARDPSEADRWLNDGQGIELEVVNALEAKWNPYFNRAVEDWNNGYPDTLSLTTSTAPRDTNCTAIPDKVKVCNGNYGETGWRGVNNVILTNGWIRSSIALMNEFYTGNPAQDDDEMQYVMCHELGHAWGVLHTDEQFGNRDLGNCMDYTDNEAANRQPDASNFQFLFELYGLLPGAAPYSAPTDAPTMSPTTLPTTLPDGNPGSNNQRNLYHTQQSTTESKATSDLINDNSSRNNNHVRVGQKRRMQIDDAGDEGEWLKASVDSVLDPHSMVRLEPSKWKLLHRNQHSEKHEIVLSPRHTLRVYKMLV